MSHDNVSAVKCGSPCTCCGLVSGFDPEPQNTGHSWAISQTELLGPSMQGSGRPQALHKVIQGLGFNPKLINPKPESKGRASPAPQ